MSTRNSCYTYFRICGNFDPEKITEILDLTPDKTVKIGSPRRNGSTNDTAVWEIGRCKDYDVFVENQMRKTISPLLDKIPLLNKIREEFNAEFFLNIVPSVYADDINPCLAPSLDVIDFCYETRTKIDIDLYVYNSDDE